MAIVLSAFVPNIINLLANLTRSEEVNRVCAVDEIVNLKNKMEKIGEFVHDAETKGIRDLKIKNWMEKLRRTIFQIDDFVDQCNIEAEKSNIELNQFEESYYHIIGTHHELIQTIKTLNKKAVEIIKDAFQLKLSSSISKNLISISTFNSSPFLEVNMVGEYIKNDPKTLVNVLLRGEENKGHLFSIVITGPGGIGKTTLAREVFRDEMVNHVFATKLWVNVNHGFTYAKILCDIIILGGGNPGDAENETQLNEILGKLLVKKRFLLVLDNLCDSKILENLLNSPLQNATIGSRVLITTSDKNIGTKIRARYIHSVIQLNAKDSWSLLCESASLSEKEMQDLNEIGTKMVNKCKGVPLAIKVIGGVLRSKRENREDLKGVCENLARSFDGQHDDIMRALYLAYQDLHPDLKQCFLCCTLFPCDFVITRRFIIEQWISQGLVDRKENLSGEEVAEGYLNELTARNLIQVDSMTHGIDTFKMHDLFRSLATFLLQGKNKYHVSFMKKGLKVIPIEITKFEHLRVLLLNMNPIKHQSLTEIFAKCIHLRVLDLSSTLIEHIPNKIGNLRHLRYLNLSHTRIKELPNTIGDLINLHFLLLHGCNSLHSLPPCIERLQNLRSLDLQGTDIDHVPFNIGKLERLNTLYGFITDNNDSFQIDQSGWSLEELSSLSKLTSLQISKLERALDGNEAREAILSNKTHLKELELRSCFSRPFQTLTEVLRIEEIFEELRPCASLESLKIVDYFGQVYPSWLLLLPKLQKLELIGCMFCQNIPLMGELVNLKSLAIKGSFVIDSIGPFTFPKLECLHIKHMQNLETWYPFPPGSVPCLKKLQIESCRKLKSLPKGLEYADALIELIILDLDSLHVIENILSIKSLTMKNCTNLELISNLPSLENLFLTNCPSLKMVENINSVRYLHMNNPTVSAAPLWIGLHSFKLQRLDLIGSNELLERCHMDGPDWSIIRDISQVYASSTDRSVQLSYTKKPFKFVTNLGGLKGNEISSSSPSPASSSSSSSSPSSSSFSSWGGNVTTVLATVVGVSAFAFAIYRYKRRGKLIWF